MKNKILVGAAVVAMAVGLATAPSQAGSIPEAGTLVITPDPVYQGGSTTIANADDLESVCEGFNVPKADAAAFDQLSSVSLEVVDPDDETIVDTSFPTDADGNWTYDVEDLTTLGEYTVYARCEQPLSASGFDAATEPTFDYAVGTFEVIAQATTTTTAAPTTTTTAAAAAVAATPAYTG
jgi:hypothetical protein